MSSGPTATSLPPDHRDCSRVSPLLLPRDLAWEGGRLSCQRPAVMAILNVTPDSFSDGGLYRQVDAAVARAWEAVAEGADLLDLGGESTRPGSVGISERQELDRVLPVLAALGAADRPYPIPISIDTSRAEVARAALREGACIVNDVTAGEREPDLLRAVADAGAAVVLMHMRGTPRTMQGDVRYNDLVGDVAGYLEVRCEAATAAGIPACRQAIDPGIGFGKSPGGCLQLLARLDRFAALERPVLIGASRKSFLGHLFDQQPGERLSGSIGAAVVAALRGASIVRVHDVAATRGAVDLAAAVRDVGR